MPASDTSSDSTRNKAKNPRRIGLEILIIGAIYAVYTFTRNHTEASSGRALDNARHIIRAEEFLSLYIEGPIHRFFLHYEWVIIASNYYYGSLHFIVTIFAMFYVFIKDPERYSRVRTTIVLGTLIALVGFISFPLMPPRLLSQFGIDHGFVDTLAQYPTFWSFNSKEFASISNQFAAMPSVHILWSTWCVFALYPYIKKTWLKVLLVAYPICTLFVIVVTSNHYILDAVGGLAVFYIAYWASRLIASITTRSASDSTASLAVMSANRRGGKPTIG